MGLFIYLFQPWKMSMDSYVWLLSMVEISYLKKIKYELAGL